MKLKQVAAVIILLSAIGWIGFSIFILIDKRMGGGLVLIVAAILIPSSLAIYLVLSQKLHRLTEAEVVEHQNRVLKMKIEQKKLKEELGVN